jgi:hypothetical protein
MSDVVDTAETVQDYAVCRCERTLVCSSCRREPGECDCSNVFDDEADELLASLGEDHYDDVTDPLLRTLLGLPSGIHCHDGTGRCLSGHCR